MALQELATRIEKRFNANELKDLFFKLNIDYDDLPGTTRKDKIRELVQFCERHDRLNDLVSLCKTLRPNELWHCDKSRNQNKSDPDQPSKSKHVQLKRFVIIGTIVILLIVLLFSSAQDVLNQINIQVSPSYVPPEMFVPQPVPREMIEHDPCQITSSYSFVNNEEEENRVKSVVQAELTAFGERDTLTLESLWLPNAIVINNQGTIFDHTDNLVFIGWENIMLFHYRGLWTRISEGTHKVEARNLMVIIKDAKATATHDGITIDGELGKDLTTYTLVRLDTDWKICRLEYGSK